MRAVNASYEAMMHPEADRPAEDSETPPPGESTASPPGGTGAPPPPGGAETPPPPPPGDAESAEPPPGGAETPPPPPPGDAESAEPPPGGAETPPPPPPGDAESAEPPPPAGAAEPPSGDRAYETLGLGPQASRAEIDEAYARLSYEYDPSRNLDPDAARRHQEIRDAYEWLLARGPTPGYPPGDGAAGSGAAGFFGQAQARAGAVWGQARAGIFGGFAGAAGAAGRGFGLFGDDSLLGRLRNARRRQQGATDDGVRPDAEPDGGDIPTPEPQTPPPPSPGRRYSKYAPPGSEGPWLVGEVGPDRPHEPGDDLAHTDPGGEGHHHHGHPHDELPDVPGFPRSAAHDDLTPLGGAPPGRRDLSAGAPFAGGGGVHTPPPPPGRPGRSAPVPA